MRPIIFLLALSISMPAMAQRPRGDQPRGDRPQSAESQPGTGRQRPAGALGAQATDATAPKPVDERPVVTHHKLTVGGKTLEYTATVALMPINDSSGEAEAHIFYMAYTLDGVGDRSKRPVTFAFNGGPGSASIWVHMGAMGPRNVKLLDNGDMPPPPFKVIDNEQTWLGDTDLVFIDPVGTGYSRARSQESTRRLEGVQGDLQSVGEFIRMYITRNERWGSPLFIAGESYGTFRAAGLAGTLVDKGIAVNGIVLISTVLDFGMIRPSMANGLPYALHLPTMTADAWYHKKLADDLQKDLPATLKEVENWAMADYVEALNKGDQLTPAERKAIVEKLVRYTGTEPRFIDDSNLRIDDGRFVRELLHDKKLTLGSYDGRLTGPASLGGGGHGESDPSGSLVRPPFEAAFQQYIRGELGYKTDMVYNVLGGIGSWDWGSENSYADTTGYLRSAMAKNPYLKVLVCAGHYDLVTPYYSAEYTMNHLGLHPDMQKRISWAFYEAGHMMYIDREAHAKLKRDFTDFVGKAVQ